MHYPEMVKPNHRYRGPIESRKKNNALLDVQASLQLLHSKFAKMNDIGGKLRHDIFKHYHENIPTEYRTYQNKISTVKGGDM